MQPREIKIERLEFPEDTQLARFPHEVARILAAVGHPEAWVSDASSIGDFFPAFDDDDLTDDDRTINDAIHEARLGVKLGVEVAMDDLLWRVAERMAALP